MSDMEKVETTVREDDPFSLGLQVLDNPLKVISLLDLFSHLQLLFKNYQIWLMESTRGRRFYVPQKIGKRERTISSLPIFRKDR
jgi:hypothetical protein